MAPLFRKRRRDAAHAPPAPEPAPHAGAPAVALPPAPERAFAARAAPPAPAPPPPATRRAIFFDVENTSRPEHIARLIDHLGIDRLGQRTEVIAVGNWRVVGADTARLLARHGAHLVHSAPSAGVRDWSDLRIAVGAGVWLAAARPGDVLEIVSDDRAFDAVGDVAAALGIAFRRLSYRALVGAPPAPVEEEEEAAAEPRGRRRGRRGRGGERAAPVERRPHHEEPRRHAAPAATEPHTAPHDEIVTVVQELARRSPDGTVLLDTLANTLKARGFSRPPGSPRLITRLRRIKELSVSPSGRISLVEGAAGEGAPGAPEPAPPLELAEVATGAEAVAEAGAVEPGRRRRRRRRGRRGGRGRRRRGGAPGETA